MNAENEFKYPQSDRWSYLWLVIGSVLAVFITGSWPLPLAGWLAPLFILRFVRTRKVLPGFLLMLLGTTIAYSIAWRKQNPMPVPFFVFGAICALSAGLAFLVDRLLVPRFRTQGRIPFVATLIFPAFLTAYEFLLLNKMSVGSVGSWAYAQFSNLALIQLVSLTGIWGLTFLTGWFASVVNWAWERSFAWREVRRGLAIFGGVLLLVLAYGEARLTFFMPKGEVVRVHSMIELERSGNDLIGELADLSVADLAAFRSQTAEINQRYIDASIREAQAGAQVVVWPEAGAFGIQEDIDALVAQGQAVARQENIYLAMSVFIIDPGVDFWLRLLVADPAGEIVINHLKYAYGLGDPISEVELQVVDTPFGRLSGIQCGDGEIPGVVQQAGRKGADILLVPSHEPSIADWGWHVRFTPFRAIENGVSVVRPTAGGISIATDPYGRTLSWLDHYATDGRVMVTQVPTQRVASLYAMVGDLFAWLVVAGFVFLAGWGILSGRKARAQAAAGSRPV